MSTRSTIRDTTANRAGKLVLLFIAAITLAGAGEKLRFEYFPSGGEPIHASDGTAPIVLIEVERLIDRDLQAQDAILDTIDAEAWRLRFVIACTSAVAPHRYATSTATAQELRGVVAGFRVTLLGPGGEILERSNRPLPAATIVAALEKHAD